MYEHPQKTCPKLSYTVMVQSALNAAQIVSKFMPIKYCKGRTKTSRKSCLQLLPWKLCPFSQLYDPILYSTTDINCRTNSWDACNEFAWESCPLCNFFSSPPVAQKFSLPLLLSPSPSICFLRNEECLLVSLFPLLSSLGDFWVSL